MNAPLDPNLIEKITQQVIANLKPVTPVNPPAGTCTGDYSKFNRPVSVSPGGESSQANAPNADDMPTAHLVGKIITASMLESVGAKKISIRSQARLTPLALDYIKDKAITVVRNDPAAANTAKSPRPVQSDQWLCWSEEKCPSVERIAVEFSQRLHRSSAKQAASSVGPVLVETLQQLQQGRIAGAVLFVRSAAVASVLANRHPAITAVVATNPAAVEQAIDKLAANVLIIESSYWGYKPMRSMVQQFIETRRGAPDALIARHMHQIQSGGGGG